jgi:hypothetical protein
MDKWHHTFSNLAWAQDLLSDVLDENYTPVTTVDIDLFTEKQKFLYAVLEAKVETAKGKAIICSHEKKSDAQKTYAELKNYHLTSNMMGRGMVLSSTLSLIGRISSVSMNY